MVYLGDYILGGFGGFFDGKIYIGFNHFEVIVCILFDNLFVI